MSGSLVDPDRDVTYAIARGNTWLLVLSCGHPVVRRRSDPRSMDDIARSMFVPLEQKLAPRSARCWRCGAGLPVGNPAVLFRALGGEIGA